MSLLSKLPIMPLYYNGETKFVPIHVSDLTEIIYQIISKEIKNETIECIGPEVLSFKEILKKILKSIQKKRLLIPMPLPIAKITAVMIAVSLKQLIKDEKVSSR